ncbi:hypothetical protein PVAND_000244 [Polypedilum vanderplanki]|uniref:C-type lectin domain-containing protein n=1 Tax=Polypedilum vanderplanki TaxID=319348 RepID=A0A9J6BKB8_POLVA|nr:hypothetical protein PVAND_000244 [Polypedilum vanderplanki]
MMWQVWEATGTSLRFLELAIAPPAQIFNPSNMQGINSDTSLCHRTSEIFNSERKLIKKICYHHTDVMYNDAENFCRNYGMELFVINSQEVAEGLLKEMKAVVAQFHPSCNSENWPDNCYININGRKSSNGKWYSRTFETLPIYENLTWIQNAEIGNCLTVKVQNGNLVVKGESCKLTIPLFCEFDVDENLTSKNTKLFECQQKLKICKNFLSDLLNL